MDASDILPPHFDLTGRVSVSGYLPDFTGNYSCVYKGLLRGDTVAIKIIKASSDKDAVKRKVLRERLIWSTLNHRNIHPFYGFSDDEAFGPFGALISPWCSKGDASRFLGKYGERMVLALRIHLWEGVLDGVAYLHGHEPAIVHGDLKPGNILIDNFGWPRICDFGLAQIFLEEGSTGMTTTSEHTGTARYLAPELVASDNSVIPTTTSDLYALGSLGLEFIYLQKPYANRINNLRGQIFRDIRARIPPAVSPPLIGWPSRRAWPLLESLWNPDPNLRPPAFLAVYRSRNTMFTIPPTTIERIARFVAIDHNDIEGIAKKHEWKRRTNTLRNLCLVSRAYRKLTMPFLYRDIRMYLESNPYNMEQLFHSIEDSNSHPFGTGGSSGLGRRIKSLSLAVPPVASSSDGWKTFSKQFCALVGSMPSLELAIISQDYIQTPEGDTEFHSLSTLEFRGLHTCLLLNHAHILQALSYLQCLCIRGCFGNVTNDKDPAPVRTMLPNLEAINVYGDPEDPHSDGLSSLFKAFSLWVMPRLKSLHFHSGKVSRDSESAFYYFLVTHGHQLQYLTRHTHHRQSPSIWPILPCCNTLRYISIVTFSMIELHGLPPHANLETISLYSNEEDVRASNIQDSRVKRISDFKVMAPPRFPKLIDAYFKCGTGPTSLSASFRTRDGFTTYTKAGFSWMVSDKDVEQEHHPNAPSQYEPV